jgi:hypothetical protein
MHLIKMSLIDDIEDIFFIVPCGHQSFVDRLHHLFYQYEQLIKSMIPKTDDNLEILNAVHTLYLSALKITITTTDYQELYLEYQRFKNLLIIFSEHKQPD